MRIRLFNIITLFFFCISSNAQENISLNGLWQFALAKNEKAIKSLDNFYTPGYSNKQFHSIPVPSNWAVLGYEEPVYSGFKDDIPGTGYYLKEFSISSEQLEGKRVLLQFDGVWSAADVWLNGQYLGKHTCGYTPFSFEVTEKLDGQKPNLLAVKVSQISREYRFDVYDDWTLGGIYRSVSLVTMPAMRWIDYVKVQTTFDDRYVDANLNIHTMICDRRNPKKPGKYSIKETPYELRFSLFSTNEKEIAQRTLTIPAHLATGREVQLDMNITSPHQWTAETPYLYKLKVELLEEGKTVQTWSEKIGFRQITTSGGILKVNGQAIKLRGVDRHDEHPDVGRATTHKHWLQDLLLMKAANINYIRCSHYTPSKGFIELCDSLGIYVGNEVSIGGAKNLKFDPSFTSAALSRAYETITRDINNPSIIYWSMGNEDELSTMGLAAIKLVKALDTTRPVLIPWRHEEWLPEDIDILSAHYWQPKAYDEWAGNSKRPVIATEYTHAYGEHGMGGLEARWNAIAKHPAGAGAAIWMWADQGIKTPIPPKTKIDPQFNQNDKYLRIVENGWDGIVDSYRNPTRDYWETKAVYAPIRINTQKVHFIIGQDSVQIPVCNEYDFTNLSDITIQWQIYEDGVIVDKGSSSSAGAPHSTTLIKLPLKKRTTASTDKTYYSWFIFSRPDGSEITRCAVELCPLFDKESSDICYTELTIKEDKSVTISAGATKYSFDPNLGQLVSAQLDNLKMIDGITPVIWHELDPCEKYSIGKEELEKAVDYSQYRQKVIKWNVSNKHKDKVIINSDVEYKIDKDNSFIVRYEYIIKSNGEMDVHYQLEPKVEIAWLPVVGMNINMASNFDQMHWLGLGPYDAYPNKQAAPIFGMWTWNGDSGTKSTRWVECKINNTYLRITNNSYVELQNSVSNKISILTNVYARPEKQRHADNSFPELRTNRIYTGQFNISLKPQR